MNMETLESIKANSTRHRVNKKKKKTFTRKIIKRRSGKIWYVDHTPGIIFTALITDEDV